MSRHNKKRRGKWKCGEWKCGKCKMPMWQELHLPSAQMADEARTKRPVHVCGGCKAMHYVAEGGKLRLLTPAELFELNMAAAETVAQIERTHFKPTAQPEGTIIISREKP